MDADNDMVRGYMAGFNGGSPELPECYKAESASFKHGWKNGRDDRVGTPRDRAKVLRARADMILRKVS